MKRIIVSGKGGSGKTTLTSLMITKIIEKKKDARLLVIDADPSSNLHISLGIEKPNVDIGSIDEHFADENNPPSDELISKIVFETCVVKREINGREIDYGYLGHHLNNSCLCGYNNALNYILKGIESNTISNNEGNSEYDYIIIDREAGVEHINRSVYGNENDYLMIVSWPTEEYIRVADEINNLANMLGTTKNRILVLNNIQDASFTDSDMEQFLADTTLSKLPKFIIPKLEIFKGLKKMTAQEILNTNKDKTGKIDSIIEAIC